MAFENIKSALYSDELWFGGSEEIWEELEINEEGIYYRDVKNLWVAFVFVVIFFILRILFESYIGVPLGSYHGISDAKPKKAPPNRILEQTYKTTRYPCAGKIESLTKVTDMSAGKITLWFKVRRNQDKPSKLTKFNECLWKMIYYTSMFAFGLYIVWDKPWLTDLSQVFENYPRHSVTPSMVWYFRIQIGFYLSLVLLQSNDSNRRDSVQMIIHHVVTVGLIALAWHLNFVRFAIMGNWISDMSDIFLDGLKSLIYLEKKMITLTLGVMFLIVWTITRLIIYPFRMLPGFIGIYMSGSSTPISVDVFFFFNIIINILNVYWTYFVYKMVIGSVIKEFQQPDQEIKDVRSSDEE